MNNWLDKYENGGSFLGTTNVGRDYSPAWGGQFDMGGSLPGSVGFTYARTGDIPDNGKYAKKTLASAQNGKEMQFYQQGLDFQPKTISQDGTRVAPRPRPLTETEWQENKRISEAQKIATEKHNKQILEERQKARNTKGTFKEKNFNIGEKFRMFPGSVGGAGELFDDYINPLKFVGDMASNLGNSRTPQEAALNVAMTAGLGAIGFDPLGSALKSPALKNAGKYLTEETALKNAYNLNPWAFKPQEGMMYRGVGEPAITDAIESGVIRQNPSGSYSGTDLFVSPNYNIADMYATGAKLADKNVKKALIEIPKDAADFVQHDKLGFHFRTSDAIPTSKAKLYKEDWLKGYKEFPKPTSSFKSELDWGAWNKEIPSNQALMQEYNAIEQTSKANGTWMKNPDGSAFKGTPEQFIQQNSENFKKAFPEGYEKGYRGAHQYIDDFKNRDRKDYATFLTDSKLNAETYAGSDDISKNFYHPDVNKSGEWVDGIYELGIPKNYSKVVGNADGNNWRFLNYDKKIADGINPARLNDSHEFRVSNLNSDMKTELDYPNNFNVNKRYLTTDDYASYVKNNSEGIAEIKNVKDQMGYTNNIKPNTVYAVDAEKVPLKSLRYNNGMFDMTNPNIYKALVPAAVGTAALQQKKQGGVIKDDRGQWAHPGEITQIDSNNITMQGVPYPVLGIGADGEQMMMQPGEDYKFNKGPVTEFPMAQKGKTIPTPTTQDSLSLFNAQIALNQFYDGEKKKGRLVSVSSIPMHGGLTSNDLKGLNEDNLDFYRLEVSDRKKHGWGTFDDQYSTHFNMTPDQVKQLEYQGLGKTKSGNEYQQYYRDLITPMQNLVSPFAMVDSRITPQKIISYKPAVKDYPGGAVQVFDYDPLAVKPYNMRTPKEKLEWEKKYGKKQQPKPKPEPVVEKPIQKPVEKVVEKPAPSIVPSTAPLKPMNRYEGRPVYSPGAGLGVPSALVGFENKGDTTYIQPEDYERFAVPGYGKRYIESKKKLKSGGNINNLDAQPIEKLDQLTNFTNYNKPTKGGWLDKYQ